MKEKFYCVGCKQHYELSVHTAQRQPSKGGSFRHSLISECPKGHRVNKLCKKEVYETYETSISDAETFESPYVGSKALSGISLTTDQLTETIGSGDFDKASLNSSGHQNVFANAEEEGNIHVTFKIQDADYATFYHTTLAPSGLSDDELVYYAFGRNEASEDNEWFYIPSDWEGVGDHYLAKVMSKSDVLDSEEGSAPVQDPMEFGEMANWTPLDGTPSLRKRKRAEGMTVGVNLEALEPTPDEPESGESMVPADSLMPEGSGHVIGSQSTSHNYTPFHADSDKVETFIVYPELYEYLMMQELLPSNKTSTKHLQDDDYEVTVPAYLLDEILAAVSEYQSTEIAEKSDSDFAFGKSKTTVAVAAAGVALMGAWLWNKRK